MDKTPEQLQLELQNEMLEQQIRDEKKIDNSLSGAMGYGSFNPFNMPSGYGFPGTEQISNTNTLFKNLRWYFVSNFRQLLSELYVEIGLVQTLCDLPVEDALRGGVEIHSKQLDEDQIKELQVSLDRDNDINVVGQAMKWTRLFGGAGVIILTDQDPEEPLELDQITSDSQLEFRAVDMWELFWDAQNTQGYDPSTQQQDFDHYNYYGEKIHKSRVMRMKGLEAPSFVRGRLRGWGFSIVEKLVRSVNQYLKGTDLGFEVLDEFKLDVYKIKNLVNVLMSPTGEQKIRQRVQLANLTKNYQNAIVMDAEDDYDHKQLSFAGLAEAMAGVRKQVAADMRFPLSKLFGASESTGGMGNNDQNDMENYNSMVESEVRNKIKYDLLRICEIKCQKLFGMVPDDLEIKFKPLRVLTATDEQTVKTQKFQNLLAARQAGEISTFEFREAINKANVFDITLDNAGDELNPDDPQIGDIVEEGIDRNPTTDATDIDDPGADRSDTKKPKKPKGEYGGKMSNRLIVMPKRYSVPEKFLRSLVNSAAFDRASYEADGGDAWISPGRRELFENPGNVDEALWSKAKSMSQASFGKEKWQFIAWAYKKLGGKFVKGDR